MKKLLFILALGFTLQVAAQDQVNWITDNEVALKQSDAQNKPILAYITDNQKTEASERLNKFISNEIYKRYASKVIWLKLDVTDKQSPNYRLGIHYTKQTTAPGLSLIDKNGKTLVDPLSTITDENIMKFLTLMYDKLK